MDTAVEKYRSEYLNSQTCANWIRTVRLRRAMLMLPLYDKKFFEVRSEIDFYMVINQFSNGPQSVLIHLGFNHTLHPAHCDQLGSTYTICWLVDRCTGGHILSGKFE